MTGQAQTAADLRDVNTKFQKASTEIVAQVAALEAALAAAGTDTTQEVTDAVEALKTTAETLDQLNPDSPTPDPTMP